MSRDEGGALAAPDLGPEEQDLAAWFSHLERPDAPAALRTRLMARPRVGRLRRLVGQVPFGVWGVASAALLLLALGSAVTIELTSPVVAPVIDPAPAHDVASQVRIREDATLTLFHDVETFDEVGLSAGELIADWGR